MTTKLSKRDIKILIVLAGVLILLLCYLLVYKNFTDKKEAADAEIAQLQPELDQLSYASERIIFYHFQTKMKQEIYFF